MVTQYANHFQGTENLEVKKKAKLTFKEKILMEKKMRKSVIICHNCH